MKNSNRLKKTFSFIVTAAIAFTLLTFTLFTSNAAILTPEQEHAFRVPTPIISVQAHVQNDGWHLSEETIGEIGVTVGTTGRSLRLECLRIGFVYGLTASQGGIMVNTHIAGIGWTGYQKAPGGTKIECGTTGQSRAIEAIQIRLYGEISRYYDVVYKLHLANTGWTDTRKNGTTCGTTGWGRRSEALSVKLVRR
jgi:uncharacterized protein YjdB